MDYYDCQQLMVALLLSLRPKTNEKERRITNQAKESAKHRARKPTIDASSRIVMRAKEEQFPEEANQKGSLMRYATILLNGGSIWKMCNHPRSLKVSLISLSSP